MMAVGDFGFYSLPPLFSPINSIVLFVKEILVILDSLSKLDQEKLTDLAKYEKLEAIYKERIAILKP